MKRFVIWGLLLVSPFAFARSENGFKVLTTNCKPRLHDAVDSAPQSPPLNIDDPGTPGCNSWEINLTFTGELASNEKNFQLPLLDINYGIGDNLQLKYEIARTLRQTPTVQETAMARSKIGIKYLFFEDDSAKLQISFYPQAEFSNPLEGLNTSLNAGSVVTWPVLLSKKISENEVGDIIFATNLGFNKSSRTDTDDSGFLRFGLGWPVLQKVSWMTELAALQTFSTPAKASDLSFQLNTGILVGLSKSIFFYTSCGQEFSNSSGKNPQTILAGFRYLSASF